MPRAVVLTQPRTIAIESYEERAPGAGEALVRTLYSGISAGTELASYRGSNPHLLKRFDPTHRLFLPSAADRPSYPLDTWGYEEAGEVVAVGPEVTAVQVGDIVYGTWGHRTHHIATEDYLKHRVLPEGLDPRLGIFSHIGPIALNGVHDARPLIGETVAVFGLGVLGQVVAQLARGSGAHVIGVDLIKKRLDLAAELGAVDLALDPSEGSPAEMIKGLTKGRGADVVIEVSGVTAALHEAIRAAAYSARVVAMGFFQGEARGLFLGEEFHHNRLTLLCSQISGVGPERSYRWDRLRLVKTTMQLQVDGVLNLAPLITHTFPFEQAAEAFRLLDDSPADALQVVLDFT